jgi:alpha-L-fucosidase 2
MKRKLLLALHLTVTISAVTAQSDKELIFDKPASHFTESLPLGNGKLGAMVFGRTNTERILIGRMPINTSPRSSVF